MKYSIGQIVYVNKPLYGWHDYSLGDCIPINAACIIEKAFDNELYRVKFIGKWIEFGSIEILGLNLKQDND